MRNGTFGIPGDVFRRSGSLCQSCSAGTIPNRFLQLGDAQDFAAHRAAAAGTAWGGFSEDFKSHRPLSPDRLAGPRRPIRRQMDGATFMRGELLAGGRNEKVGINWSGRPVPPLIEAHIVVRRGAHVTCFANADRRANGVDEALIDAVVANPGR